MFIDTHCHLTSEYAAPDELAAIIARARDSGVSAMICAGADPADFDQIIKIVNEYENVFCTLGVHPEYATGTCVSKGVTVLESMPLSHPKVIGIGEIGLDYHYSPDNKKQQIELFEKQLEIAKKYNMPVAIHTRDAEDDTARILDGSVTGVMHCYTSSWDLAKKMLDRGFYFSASGIITFKNSAELRETFAKIPIDRIVIETDSPYCAPVPYRGKPCEPAMVVEVAKIMAQIKNLDLSDLESILMENTRRLYPKINI